jgi:hypothetical protein
MEFNCNEQKAAKMLVKEENIKFETKNEIV